MDANTIIALIIWPVLFAAIGLGVVFWDAHRMRANSEKKELTDEEWLSIHKKITGIHSSPSRKHPGKPFSKTEDEHLVLPPQFLGRSTGSRLGG